MRKRLKVRALTFVAAVILIVSCIVIPCSAASSFPDNYANLLDCDELFTRLSSKINAALYDFGYDASVGTCTLTSKNENNYHLGSAFIGTIQDICPGIKAGVWYTFHCEEADSKRNFSISWENYTRELKNGDVFMLDAAELTQRIFISVYNVIPADKLYTYAHLAIVPSSMPLSGNFTDQTYPSYFNYDQALDDAKKEFVDLVDSQTVNIFKSASFSVNVFVLGEDFGDPDVGFFQVKDIPFTISADGGIPLQAFFSYAVDQARRSFPNVDYTYAYFSLSVVWPLPADNVGAWDYNDGPIYIKSASVNGLPVLADQIDVSPVVYKGYLDASHVWSNGKKQVVSDYQVNILSNKWTSAEDVTIYNFDLRVGDGTLNLLSTTVGWKIFSDAKITSLLYTAGYGQGYIDGENAEYGKVKQESYSQGYDVGYVAGKKDGLKVSESGDWTSLISAVVEAPVNYFQSLFHFEILGLDMRVAFGSILALCVLLIIVKKVIL